MTASSISRQPDPFKAIVLMVACVCSFAIVDASGKWLTGNYPVAEILFASRLLSPFFALAMAARSGGIRHLRTRRLGAHAWRSLANAVSLIAFFLALRYLPLADVVAIYFIAPLLMCLLSTFFLDERVGWRRWVAIIVGFSGVILIARPSEFSIGLGFGIGIGACLAIVSAFGDAALANITRHIGNTESAYTMLFWSSLFILAGTGAFLPFHWVTPRAEDMLAFGLIATFGTVGQFFLAQAFRYGEVGLLAPLEYIHFFWASLFGFLIWNEIPTVWVLAGVAIIIGSNLYVVRAEIRQSRNAASLAPLPVAASPAGSRDSGSKSD
jgi:drug/metabolite transporter (DMT)-like permease